MKLKKIILTGVLSVAMFVGSVIPSMAAELTQSSRWVGSENTWRVSDNNGGYLKNCWFQDDITKDWYLLGAGDDNTIMFSGLITDQSTGKTYLLNTNHDGTYGRMLTADGTYNINGKNVYLTFNQSHDGTFGAITSGLSEVRNTGIAEKQLPSIPSDNNTDSGSGQGQSITPPSNEGNTQQSSSGTWDKNSGGVPIGIDAILGTGSNTGGYSRPSDKIAAEIAAGMRGGDYN